MEWPFVDDPDNLPGTSLLLRRIDWGKYGGGAKYAVGETPPLNANSFRFQRADIALSKGFPGPCLSVCAETALARQGLSADDLALRFPGDGLAGVRVEDLRQLMLSDGSLRPQGAMMAPTDDEPWHAVIFDPSEDKPPNAVINAIIAKAFWVVPLVKTQD